ncbi:MAG: peptidoglycan-binding protein [Clostridiales bacterium]|jgi:peptidoglycan hydrolase-like protein with peptidoglycan-binding domain|nr:peptidoglycan-binding protein [Clostridiales bacterium]
MYLFKSYVPKQKVVNPYRIYPAQMDTQNFGRLQVRCTTENLAPIENATVAISYTGVPNSTLEQLTTDASGLTEEIELEAPPIDYSLAPSQEQPYATYTIQVNAEGFAPLTVQGAEVLPEVTALQESTLREMGTEEDKSLYVIPPHTLFGDYPPKIAEAEIKDTAESGEIVLQNVVIPEFVVVHDGPPTDTSATNHYVRFRDYIKNVASSEIYATWPEATIQANILAILSFTLNRVFTEWYRNQGYNFTVTSSTAFDHKWIPGRNIYSNIGLAVDQLFVNYLSRPNVKQPILTQYCDGYQVQCPNWMTQWGSKDLGDQGYSAIEIIRHFYGNDMFINTAPQVAGVPASWPGQNLNIGASGGNVRMIQEQLNRIADTYIAIPKVAVNGQYDERTAEAVRTFQQTFNMPATGIVDLPTWYRISGIYVAVTRMAEL